MNRRNLVGAMLTAAMGLNAGPPSTWAEPARTPAGVPIYKQASHSVESRVEDLLARMTLAEKVGQMNMPCGYERRLGKDVPGKQAGVRQFAAGTLVPGIGPAGGFFTLSNNMLFEGTQQQALFFNELQKIALESTRLGIPLLQTEEGTHGVMRPGATIFPEGPAIGSMWNLDLVRKLYAITAREARMVGIHQVHTLVPEPNRDPRLGRNIETYSEDPFYCGLVIEAVVGAVQGKSIASPDHAIAGLAHFPGQSEPVGGLERGDMEVSERKLRDVFLPPWVAGVKRAGALGVMATYPAIDGIPAHSSAFLLTRVLREELRFKGIVLSEGGGLSTLVYNNLAADQKEAGALAIKAGVDVGISFEDGYLTPLIENVAEGRVSVDLIDRAVRRILRLKFALGLFENPYVDVPNAVAETRTDEAQRIALEAAREAMVLLKNENGTLPLSKAVRRIAVIGPNADNAANQLGDYTTRKVLQEIVTVLKGVKAKVGPGTVVDFVQGCEVLGTAVDEIDRAKAAAKAADAAIVVLGENQWGAPEGTQTNGEGYDVASLDLTGMQEDLLRAVHATGTPTVLVLINGRPLSIRWAAEHIPAILEAWIPGEQGGHAVADVLFGDYNPGGKLAVTVPRHSGQLPMRYDYLPSRVEWIKNGWGRAYADMPATPLWEFGFGLSYTKYDYGNLKIAPRSAGAHGSVQVSVDVRNAGDREGREIVQLYIHDVQSSVVQPVKKLRGFSRVPLAPGETRTVQFALDREHLGFFNRHAEFVVEPGDFDVLIGASSEDIRATGRFTIEP
jgi:beta-glucosidase